MTDKQFIRLAGVFTAILNTGSMLEELNQAKGTRAAKQLSTVVALGLLRRQLKAAS
jgi:hypothetical protein